MPPASPVTGTPTPSAPSPSPQVPGRVPLLPPCWRTSVQNRSRCEGQASRLRSETPVRPQARGVRQAAAQGSAAHGLSPRFCSRDTPLRPASGPPASPGPLPSTEGLHLTLS